MAMGVGFKQEDHVRFKEVVSQLSTNPYFGSDSSRKRET